MRLNQIPIAFVCCVITLGTGWAQRQPAKAGNPRFGNPTSTGRVFQDYIYGVIKKIDSENDEMVLDKTKFGIEQTLRLQPKTRYIHDGKPSSLTQLKVGDQVYVDVKTDKKTGQMTAKKVVSGVTPTSLR